jgi:FkbM family methyltransferase
MKQGIDFKFLRSIVKGKENIKKLKQIKENEKAVINQGKIVKDRSLFSIVLDNYQLWLRKGTSASSIMTYLEIFKDKTHMKIPDFLGENDEIIIDLGGNEGYYALAMKKNNPKAKIVSIEPITETFKLLKKNIQSNNLKNVILINKAITSRTGKITFEIVPEVSAISSADIYLQGREWLDEKRIKKITVDSITLENLCKRLNIKKIDLLKLDVEGAELEILKSSRKILMNTKKVVIEYHNTKLKNKCINILQKLGFKLILKERGECADVYFIRK